MGKSEDYYQWDDFRQQSKLDKSDEALNEYFKAFMSMCKRTVGLTIQEKEGKFFKLIFLWLKGPIP